MWGEEEEEEEEECVRKNGAENRQVERGKDEMVAVHAFV